MKSVTTVGAGLGFLQTNVLPFGWNVGPSGRYWEMIRRRVSRFVGRVFDERAGPRPVSAGEYAGTVSLSLDELEHSLWDDGFVRNVFSRIKVREDQTETGSWVYRESPLAPRQLHLMLFCRAGGGIDVYAHEEPSSVHPFVGTNHFVGTGQDVSAGVERARECLPLERRETEVKALEAPWHAHPDVERCENTICDP